MPRWVVLVRRSSAVSISGTFDAGTALRSTAARLSIPRLRRNAAWSSGPKTRAPALSGLRQRLKIDMRGEVDAAWRLQRVGVGMLADRLERVAGRAFGMTVVDHQRSAQRVCQPPADLKRNRIGAPFEYCTDLR